MVLGEKNTSGNYIWNEGLGKTMNAVLTMVTGMRYLFVGIPGLPTRPLAVLYIMHS